MLIDAHVHLTNPQSPANALFRQPATPDDLLRQMDRSGITAAVVLGLPGFQTPDEVIQLCRCAPDRLFPLLGVDPRRAEDVARIRHTRSLGFYGLKLHPRLNQLPVTEGVWG